MTGLAKGVGIKREWPVLLLLGLAIVWLIVTFAALAGTQLPAFAGFIPQLFPPLAAMLAAIAFLPLGPTGDDHDAEAQAEGAPLPVDAQAVAALTLQLEKIDKLLARSGKHMARLSNQGTILLASTDELDAASERLTRLGTDSVQALSAMSEALPGITGEVQAITSMLGQTDARAIEQVLQTEAMLRDVDGRTTAVTARTAAALAEMSELLARIEDMSKQSTKDIAARAYALDAAVTGVLDTSAATLEPIAASINANAAELQRMLEIARAELDAIGNAAVTRVDEQLARLAELSAAGPVVAAAPRPVDAVLEDPTGRAADAAQTSAMRVAAELDRMLRRVAETEARINESSQRLQAQAGETLTSRATRIIDRLMTASVDVAKLLAIEVDDRSWARFLGGDRSLFVRAILKLASSDDERRIALLYAGDMDFGREAAQYINAFQSLIHTVLEDSAGEAMALVLLSSDLGKLYVLLSQALGQPVIKDSERRYA